MLTAHQHRQPSEADILVRQILSNPDRRLRAVVALRDGRADDSVISDAVEYRSNPRACHEKWEMLADIIHGEANDIRRKLGLTEHVRKPGLSPLPALTWSNLMLYRELFEFWCPEGNLPTHDEVIGVSEEMARLIVARFPGNRPYAEFCRREALEHLARDCFGLKGDLFRS